ncbi:MAG TPA: ATP-binding protein [Blastocatellia bacterium]|nr:ATP-binding protein [Blastocatellia bacterium]
MRSLFLKIFMWFGLAMVIVISANFLSSYVTFREDSRGRPPGNFTTMFAQTAVEKLEREGKAAAINYLDTLEKTTLTRSYLFDQDGNEITERNAPPEAKEAAARAKSEREVRPSGNGQQEYIVSAAIVSGENHYVLVHQFGGRPPRPPFLPFWPRNWWVQLTAVLITAGLLCYWLARYISSPVARLRAATQQLASGDLTARVGAAQRRRRDEVADLGRDFDIMAERIETLMASQQRLLHDISHELRSPLARLKIALELARQDEGAEVEWALDRIEREADRLNDLIGQLLTIARLDSKSPMINSDPVDLKRLVQEIVLDADFEARNHNRMVAMIKSEDCLVNGNQQLLHSAIENVVRNAMSYTAEGTAVEVSLWCDGECAVIRVLDQGSGVPQAALADIFRPFYRVADARDRQSGGIGLGLSISQRAVEVHGGTVSASNAPRGGLLVEIVLPITKSEIDSDSVF